MKNPMHPALRSLLLLGLASSHLAAQTGVDPVARLRQLNLANVEFTLIEPVRDGRFQPERGPAFEGLPPFCRVAATLTPTRVSNIRIEIWLPESPGWNGRLLGTGNGGAAGGIVHRSLEGGLRRGFATVNTDLGTAPRGLGPVTELEKASDWGHRATHEMTRVARRVIREYYGAAPHHSYFFGSSTGGHQGLTEAQRYPGDYDGIMAGAPGNNRTQLHAMFFYNWQVLQQTPGGAIPRDLMEKVHERILQACAGTDGGAPTDPFLTDPRMCAFDLDQLLARGDGEGLLTEDQVHVLKQVQAGPLNPDTGERIYSGLPLGSEMNMPINQVPEEPRSDYIFRWALQDDFDSRSFNLGSAFDRVNEVLASNVNANGADLSEFRERGGKLILFAGTEDCITPFQDAVHYYDRAVDAHGGLSETRKFCRLFVVPGLSHVMGGPGPTEIGQNLGTGHPVDKEHDLLEALVAWVEAGEAPEKLVGTAFMDPRDPAKGIRLQRPLYPYPLFPHYKAGPIHEAASFEPVEHPRGRVPVPAARSLK